MPSDFELQREIARVGLGAAQGEGFALAGSGAIREHGLTQRPTQDVDLFTVMRPEDPQAFGRGVAEAVDAWQKAGYEVLSARQSEGFANFVVGTSEGRSVEVDMGIDWRALDPVQMEVGPVLSVEDAIGNKISALFSRSAPRDFLDVDSIRASGVRSDAQLVESAQLRDPGFDVKLFAQQIARVDRIDESQVGEYGVSGSEWAAVQQRFGQWAEQLQGNDPVREQEAVRQRSNLAFPQDARDAVRRGGAHGATRDRLQGPSTVERDEGRGK